MHKGLFFAAIIVTTAGLAGCGMNDFDPQNGVSIVTSTTPRKGVISEFPTTPPSTTRPTTTTTPSPTTTTTTVPPSVITTVIVVQPPVPVQTTTVAPPPPPPAAAAPPVRPAVRTLAASSTPRTCGGTQVIDSGLRKPPNGAVATLTDSTLHFQAPPTIPIRGVVVQTAYPSDSFSGLFVALDNSMIGFDGSKALDFKLTRPDGRTVVVAILCDS